MSTGAQEHRSVNGSLPPLTRAWKSAELARGDMIEEDYAAMRMDVDVPALVAMRKKGYVLALDDGDGVYRYPEWQIDFDGQPHDGLAEVLDHFRADPWEAYRFFLSVQPGTGGHTGASWMRLTREPGNLLTLARYGRLYP